MIHLLQTSAATLEDGDLLDIQSILDPTMSTAQSLGELAIRFFLNLLVCGILVHFFYYPKSRRKDYVFTFLTFSSAMLLLLYAMGRVDVGVGLTLGLFAIFGVIRYRTETVPVREMTYLFVIITVAVINGLALNISYAELLIANLLIFGLIAVLESRLGNRRRKELTCKIVLYDRIENIVPARRDELVSDLEKRIGVKVEKLEIGHVDLLKDAAFIKVYYYLAPGEQNGINTITREKDFNND